MRLFIEPTEPLLFRTGRPFDAGENNFAETIFPPTPETLQGAIRATIAAHWDTSKTLAEVFQLQEVESLIGNRRNYGRFRITCISLARFQKATAIEQTLEQIFPAPSHILQGESDISLQVKLVPEKKSGVYTNLPENMQMLYAASAQEKVEPEKLEPVKGWLTEKGLRAALQTDERIADADIIPASDIFVYEQRMGIGMNNSTKTTQEGQLYQVQMVRMNSSMSHHFVYGFVVDVRLLQNSEGNSTNMETFVDDEQTQKQLKLPDDGWMILGGERRAARFTVVHTAARQNDTKREGTLLYLSTPAALDNGWQPGKWSFPFPPVAVSISRYQPIGGWLLEPGSGGGYNKATRRCVPAGSVYFFDQPVTIPPYLTDYGRQIGYGITHVGDWK